jgi:hypothetical protein
MMMKKQYVLTIRVPFETFDDLDARIKAKEFMAGLSCSINWDDKKKVKLQEVFENKEPRGISL